MFTYRITKYNPQYLKYCTNEWTSYSDIGKILYVGSQKKCELAIIKESESGLFVESYQSPYHKEAQE